MTLKSWIYLFWTTLVLGTVSAFLTGLILIALFSDFAIVEVKQPGFNGETMAFIAITGALFGMLSLTGFFSYMIMRFIALGMFRKKWVWDIIQACLIVIAFVDTIYLRYTGADGESWLSYAVLPVVLMAASVAVSWWKVKLTQPSAFLPTLLFMFVVSLLEAVPALRLNNAASSMFMLTPLTVCNAWQILRLHKLLKTRKGAV